MGAGDVTVTVTYASNALLGDVDCNGVVDFADISMLYLLLIGEVDITAQGQLNADMDQDGNVNFGDVSNIYLFVIGL
jgi:hypothetical protein